MVVSTAGSKLKSKLSAQWEYMLEMWLRGMYLVGKNDMLVWPCQQVHTPLMDLPKQYSAALSDFADKHRRNARDMTLRGPLVGCRLVQSLIHIV